MPRQNLVSISPYPVGHGKNGGGGGTTIIMGGQGSGNSKNLTVHSINASKGNIDNLRVKSLSANDADILYLMTQEGQIIKLKGDTLNYNAGYIGSLQSDEITAKKLNVDDIEAVNAWIKTLQSESITTEYLTVTKQAHFFELVIDKIRSVGGQLIISPASCVVDWVWGVTNDGYVRPTAENLSNITAFDVFWRSTEDTGRSVDQEFLPLDQVICQSFNNVSTGVNYDVANKYYWRLVDAVYSNYGYVNLTTGAITQNSQAAINNKYDVIMLATKNKDEFDNYYDNEMIWRAAAQTIQGIQTNVQWVNQTLEEGQAINGIFSSSSQVYGMRIFPSEDNEQLNITSKLDFIIKQQVGESFIIPNKINIGIYFTNDTYLVFNNVEINNEGELTLDLENPNIPGLSEWKLDAPIEEIVIVSTADVNWHLCHRMTISNTDMDDILDGYASIPSVGDNLVQLGYRGTDDTDRQSAIIISSRPTPDQGGQFDGRTLRPIYPPSYVQYKGIGSKETASENYDLYRFRQSFIDGRGASFVGDITMCTIGGNSIENTINNIETKSKKILTSTSIIQLYQTDNQNAPIRLYPSTLDISIMSPNQNGGTDTLTTVPEGYEINLIYDRPAGSDTTVVYNAGDSLSGITLIAGSQIDEISKLRIFLYKVTGTGQDAQRAMIDSKDLTYMRANTGDAVDGGHTEFRYKNAHSAPELPTNGSDGYSDAGANGWSKMVTSPDVDNEIWTWQCQCYVTAAGIYGIWEGPIRITGGNGKNGNDGTDIEFIYTRNNGQLGNIPTPPSAPVNDSQGHPVKDQDDWHGTDSNGVTWTDNPAGVAADMKFEYMAQRFKLPGSTEWTAYTTPVVWSNWGVKGTDGDGFEYIFLLSELYPSTQVSNPTPNDWQNPNSNYQLMDEYVDYLKQHVPAGYEHWWTDDPESVTQNFPYIYVCKRTKKQNSQEQMVWGQFSDPALWGRYASQGESGGHYEFRYCNFTPTNDNTPQEPTAGSNGVGSYGSGNRQATWGYTVSNPNVNSNEFTYMSQCYLTPNSGGDTYGTWTPAVRITGGNGESGEDGADIEFIYAQKSAIWNSPAAPTTADDPTVVQDDWPNINGHTPSKTINGTTWYDNPQGVTASVRYEYMAQRIKPRGSNTWGPYTVPVVWSAFGERGQDGDGFEYIYKRSESATTLPNPTPSDYATNTTYQSVNEYAPYLSGWSDDPQGVSETYKYEWVSVRTRTNGVWGPFSDPALWSRWAMPGQSGGHWEMRYCNFTPTTGHTTPTKPTDGSNGIGTYGTYQDAATWARAVGSPDVAHGEFTYMTQCFVDGEGSYQNSWTDPFRITGGNGKDGEDGDTIEFIYKHFSSQQTFVQNNDNPAYWAANQTNDYTGPSGYQWTDNPTGVDATNMYEYVSQREKTSGTWGKFITPVIWSKWGEKGQDGDGFEYIYKLSETSAALPNPTPNDYATNYNYQNSDEYAPYLTGWTDDPQGVSESMKFEWVCVRKSTNGVWGPFSDPALWARWSMPGQAGGHWEFRYCNFTPTTGHTTPTKPTDGSNGIGTYGTYQDAATWAKAVSSPDVANGEFTYMTQCFVDGSGSYQDSWTDPVRITGGNGKDGEDGDSIEFIYKHFDSVQVFVQNNNNPAYWSANQTDDYTGPSGYQWTDNPTGVDASNMYEYVSQRERNNGTWGKFITPVIWSKWGEKGQDGDGFEYIYKLSETSSSLSNPTPSNYETNSNYQNSDEYAPYLSGWTDDPQGVSESMKYEWVCVRKKTNGHWGPFSDPALWARWSMPGQAGGHWEMRYCNFTPTTGHTTPTKPTDGSNGIGTYGSYQDAATWARAVSSPDVANGQYTYMTQCFVDGSGSYQDSWTDPFRITGGNGKDGEDGDTIEFIYKHFDSVQTFVQNNNNPAYWSANQTDDYTGPSGYQWTDNPTGVDASNMYEYVSQRERNNGTWGKFITPVIWSKWGEKGQDGDGFEYIYKLSDSSSSLPNPTPSNYETNSNYQNSDEYANYLSGWTDDPQGVSESMKYEWVCVRKKTNGHWGPFSDPALWARWSMPGQAGGHWEFRYCNFTPTTGHTTPTKPTNGSNGIGTYGSYQDAATWAKAVSSPNVANGQFTYMTQCFVDGSGSYQDSWTDPVRITGGNGKDGEDGDSIEFIYKHFIAEQVFVQNNNNPAYWSANQTDDYTGPSGYQWTDNPTGVDSSNMYEYVATRERNNGTWGKFSTPVIWSKWGEKGMDGDGYEYIYKTSNSSSAPAKPSNSPQQDEYVPSGWSDDPTSIDASNPYLWVCVRKKHNGTWGSWSNPALWSHYATAESGIPGPPGESAKFDHLICNKSVLTAMVKTALSDGNAVNLYCNLDYSMLKVDGSTSTVTSIASPYKLQLKAYNRNFSMIWSRYVTSDGTASGTPSGSYQKDNLLNEVNPSGSYGSADYRDYMKCYSNSNGTIANRAPIYLEVTLLNGSSVCDRDIVQVIIETGAVFKVIDDDVNPKITAAVTSTTQDLQGWVTGKNYATQTWTSSEINTKVGQEIDSRSLVTVSQMQSEVSQTSSQILSTVSQTYATKDSIEGLPTTKVEMVDLTSSSYDRSKFYPCSISLERNRTGYQRIQVQRYLDSSTFGSGPSQWATHSNSSYGFICELDWNTIGCGWGSTWSIGSYQYGPDYNLNSSTPIYPRFINKYIVNWTRSYNGVPADYVAGNICQNPYSSKQNSTTGWADEIVYLRGGSKYKILTDFEQSEIDIWSSGYSWSGSGSSFSAPVKTYTQFNLDSEDAITRSEIRQTVDEISLSVIEERAATKQDLNSVKSDVNSLESDVNSLDTNVSNLKTNIQRTGVDITNGKIRLQANKVTFENSAGTVSNKIWIDPTAGTLHAENGEFSGTLNASVMYTSVFEINKDNATASGGELQYNIVNNNQPIYNSYVIWRHSTDTNEKEMVVILPSASTYKGIEFEFFAPFLSRPLGTKNVWIRSSSSIRYLRSSSTSDYNESRGYLDSTYQLIMPYNKMIKIKSMTMNGLWNWVVSSGDKWRTNEYCLNTMYNAV